MARSLPLPELSALAKGTSSGASSARLSGWMVLLVALLSLGVYANSLRNDFAFDDVGVVRDNPHVADLDWLGIWHDNYWQNHNGMQPDVLYRPLTLWSYLANQAILPGVAWPFHLVNVLLHGLVTALVTLLAWRLLGDRVIAVVTGLLFAVHPLHTEVVANVVGRAELLAATWSLLALLIFVPQVPLTQERSPERRPWWHGIIVAACFFAALLSKETPANLLGVVVLLDLWRWVRWPRASRPGFLRWGFSRSLRYYLPMTMAFFIYFLMRIHGPGLMADPRNTNPLVNMLVRATPAERIVTPFALLAKYFKLMFWPVHLSADYSAPSILPTANPLQAGPALGILICVLTGIVCIRSWKKYPQITLLTGFFFLGYFLMSNVIRIGTIFGERLMYWPGIFILMGVAWAAVAAWRGVPQFILSFGGPQKSGENRGRFWQRASIAALSATIFLMCWRTIVRNTDWHDNITLAVATGRDNPESAKACYWAGGTLVNAEDKGFQEVGRMLLRQAIELYPDFGDSYWELAKDCGRRKDIGNSMIYLAHMARLDPGTPSLQLGLMGIVSDMRHAPAENYMPTLKTFAEANPKMAEAYFSLAVAYRAQKQWDLAETNARKALALGQRNEGDGGDQYHEAAAEIGRVLFEAGKTEEAVAMFRQYVTRLHRSVDARCTMAVMLLALDFKKHPEAVAEAAMNLKRAQEVDPNNPQIRVVRSELVRTQRFLASARTPVVVMPEGLAEPEKKDVGVIER